MKVFVYSVLDRASGFYDRPFVARSDQEAVRSFGDIARDEKHPIGQHPDDYTLMRLGVFDDNTGAIEPQVPEKLFNAAEMLASRPEEEESCGQ